MDAQATTSVLMAARAYAYVGARYAVAVALMVIGAVDLSRWLYAIVAAGPIRYLFWWGNLYNFVVSAVLDIAPIVAGVAIFRQRARALATAYCLLGLIAEVLRFLFRYPFGVEHLAYFFVYAAAAVFLLLPRPRMPVRVTAAEPDDTNWREWLLARLQGEGVQFVRDRFPRGFLVLLASALGFLLVLVIVLFFNIPVIVGGAPRALMYVIIPIVMFTLYGVMRLIERLSGVTLKEIQARATIRVTALSAQDELQRTGSRRPVFYLRSFALDTVISHEAEVVRELRTVGPVIAIGRPAEDLPPLGAARFYVDDAHWRAKVQDITKVAQLVVWTTGVTDGLRWELTHLRQTMQPERLILWAHPHLLGLSGAAVEAEWTRFIRGLGGLFPVPLPEQLGDTRFFFFESGWRWIAVRAAGEGAQVAALNTVLVEKGLRRRKSSREIRLRAAFGRLIYIALFVVFFGLLFLKFFPRR